jgi:hypothetical protein
MLKRLGRNKKGYLGPLVMGLFGLVFLSLAILVSVIVTQSFTEDLLNGYDASEQVEESVTDMGERLPQSLDGLVLIVLFGLVLGGLVFSFFVDYSPVMFFLLVFVSLALLLGPMLFSNLWIEIVEDPEIVGFTSSFPITNFVMNWYAYLWFGFNMLFLFVFTVRDRF